MGLSLLPFAIYPYPFYVPRLLRVDSRERPETQPPYIVRHLDSIPFSSAYIHALTLRIIDIRDSVEFSGSSPLSLRSCPDTLHSYQIARHRRLDCEIT